MVSVWHVYILCETMQIHAYSCSTVCVKQYKAMLMFDISPSLCKQYKYMVMSWYVLSCGCAAYYAAYELRTSFTRTRCCTTRGGRFVFFGFHCYSVPVLMGVLHSHML